MASSMWPFRKNKPPALSRRAVLESVPIRRDHVESSLGPNGSLILTVRRREHGWVRCVSLLIAIPRKRTFELDERGQSVWHMCDGAHSVRDLGRVVAEKWGLGPEAARQAVVQYLGQLTRRGLIEMKIPGANSDAPTEEKKQP